MTDPVVKVTVSVAEWIQSTKEERDDLMERLNGYAEGQAQVVWELAP